MTRSRIWGAVALAAALVVVGAAFNAARAGTEGKDKIRDKKVVIFRSGGSWLGVQIADIDADRGKELGLRDVHGAEVQSVSPGSPAEEAGIKEGDVITEYQGSRIEGVSQLTRLVRETPSGRTAHLEVWRNGASKDLQVTMKAREHDGDDLPGVHVWSGGDDDGDGDGHGHMTWFQAPTPPAPPEPPDIDLEGLQVFGIPGMKPRLGITLDSVGKQLADYFGVKQGGGALVTSVGKGSAGEAAGLKAGDVIVRVDDDEVRDAGDLHRAMRERRGKALTLGVVRERREISIKVPEPPAGETPAPGARSSRSAVEQRQIQREVQRAMREARRASGHAIREVMMSQRAAYADALRAVHEAARDAGEGSEPYREALQEAIEELQRELDRQHEMESETPDAIDLDIDEDSIPGAIEDATQDGVEDAVDDGAGQGREDAEIEEARTRSHVSVDDAESANSSGATEEQRAEIRRAVEEARRIRIESQEQQPGLESRESDR